MSRRMIPLPLPPQDEINLDAYYTKTEIDSVIGDIETALDTILGV